VGRRVFPYSGLETGAVDARVTLLIAVAPPGRYNFANTRNDEAVFHSGQSDELLPDQGLWAFYGTLRNRSDCGDRRREPLFDGRASEIGEIAEDLLTDFRP
jgi:hypothetical protein